MQPTSDIASVRMVLERAFGSDRIPLNLTRPGVYAFADEAGAVVYTCDGPGLYDVVIGRSPGADSAQFRALHNEAIAWMFVHTDALVVRGRVHKDNEASLAFIRSLNRSEFQPDGDMVITLTPIARWARQYGIEKAISEMRAAGQAAKADKLEAAARTAGAL